MRPHPPYIAIIGRTNVGKSTLFNRLIEEQKALVSDIPGTTRDRQEADCLWRGKIVRLIDTGGLDVLHETEIERDIVKQAERAMAQADLIMFVVDMKTGPMPQEQALALKIIKAKKPVIVVGNKAETPAQRNAVASREWRLRGLPAPLPVSALRGTGLGDLLDRAYEELERIGKPPAEITDIVATRVAVIGKPNVGKSSLLNAILKEERFIVSDVAHTTREPNDTLVEVDGTSYVLIDTAGIRKMGKVKKARGLEAAGVKRTVDILKNTDVVLFVLDASEPLGSQDRTLAGLVSETPAGVIIVVNKWDLIGDKTPSTINEFKRYIAGHIPFVDWAPVVFVSAKTGQRVPNLFPIIDEVQRARFKQIPDEELDAFLKSVMKHHLPARGKGPAHPKIAGMKQTGVAPPTFTITIRAKRTDVLHPSYLRYLENQIHDAFGFSGTPVHVRSRLPKVRGG